MGGKESTCTIGSGPLDLGPPGLCCRGADLHGQGPSWVEVTGSTELHGLTSRNKKPLGCKDAEDDYCILLCVSFLISARRRRRQLQEWAVSIEMGSWIAFEPAIAIEGLAFDVFGKSELLARQASSTL